MFGEGVGGKEERLQTTNLSLCRTSSFLNTLYQTMIGKQGDTTLPISAVEDLTRKVSNLVHPKLAEVEAELFVEKRKVWGICHVFVQSDTDPKTFLLKTIKSQSINIEEHPKIACIQCMQFQKVPSFCRGMTAMVLIETEWRLFIMWTWKQDLENIDGFLYNAQDSNFVESYRLNPNKKGTKFVFVNLVTGVLHPNPFPDVKYPAFPLQNTLIGNINPSIVLFEGWNKKESAKKQRRGRGWKNRLDPIFHCL